MAENAVRFLREPGLVPNPNPAAPLAAVLSFRCDGPVETSLTIRRGAEVINTLRYGPDADPDVLPVVGFVAGCEHQVSVCCSDPEGQRAPACAKLNFSAPALPDDATVFPQIAARRNGRLPMEPGFTLFNPRRRMRPGVLSPQETKRFNQGFGLLSLVNGAGDVVWWYRTDSRINTFRILRNGNLLYLTADSRAVEIDLLGNPVARWVAARRPEGPAEGHISVDALTFHHSIDELPNGDFVVLGSERRLIRDYYSSEYAADAPRQDQWVMGDEVLVFTREGEVTWRWNAYDHMDPWRIGYQTMARYWKIRGFPDTIDWSHANKILYWPERDQFVVNFRLLSAVMGISRATGEISWIAGEPSGWDEALRPKLLTLSEGSRWFWHQHSPSFTPDGRLVLFDNGNYQARPFDPPASPTETHTRVLLYDLDVENKRLTEVWNSDAPNDPPVVSFAMGSTQYLPSSGNCLAGYGFLIAPEALPNTGWDEMVQAPVWSRVREMTMATPSQVVWEVTLGAPERMPALGWTSFGAQRVPAWPAKGED